MKRSRLWISATIIASVILIAFALSVPHTRDIGIKTSAPSEENAQIIVTLHDAFKKGVHTITGSLETPNACASVSALARLTGDASSTQHILVEVSLQADSGICLQVPTRMNFKTTISAPANLSLTATVNGSLASTTPS